jgi:hypothetical protein
MAFMRTSAFLLMLACGVGNASANSLLSWFGHFKFASEIVVPLGGAAKSSATSASESRKKARSSVNEASPPVSTTIILAPEADEEGVLAPSRMGVPADNRAKARDYSRGLDPANAATVQILIDNTEDGSDTNQRSLEKNRNKARRYSDSVSGSGSKPGTYVKIGTSVGVVGPDGVVVFVCDDTNNIAGRIGDDTQSGNFFSVVVNGKQVKARCK